MSKFVLLQENKWYRRRDGKIIGPAKCQLGWCVGGFFYHPDGKFDKASSHNLDLIEEIDPWVELNAKLDRKTEDEKALDEIADIFNIGSDARRDRSVIVENVRNLHPDSSIKAWQWPAWLKAKWIAQDQMGNWYAFPYEPSLGYEAAWADNVGDWEFLSPVLYDFTPPPCTDWRQSKRRRPVCT